MKNLYKFFALLGFFLTIPSFYLFAQVGINTDNGAPDPSAMLDVKSTVKGFLPPRMTSTEMNSIPTPSQGLIVYNITVNSLYWYNGSVWMRINEPYSETDPIFAAHPSYGITTGNIGNWNTAFTNRILGAAGSLPLTLSLSGNQLSGSISIANSTTNGYLTSPDWNTFNNKVSSQWTTGISSICYNGGNVGIGTSAPHALLQLASTQGNRKIVLYEAANNDNQYFGFGINGSILRYQVGTIGDRHVFYAGNGSSDSYELMRIQGDGTVGIGTSSPQASAILDVTSTSKGFLPPRVALTAINSALPVASPASGLLVYNTATAGTSPNNVTPGYYYWNGSTWSQLSLLAGGAGTANYVSKWSSAGTLSTSLLYDNGGNLGIGTTSPVASAALDISSIDKGFLPPRMTTAQRNTIASPASGLVIYNTDEKALNLYSGIAWNSMTPVPAFVCGLTISINHLVSGGVAPVNKTVAYETTNGIPGEPTKCWITRNLGASQQATVVSDATEASAGWYFQFNRKQGYKHDGTTRTPNTAWNATNDNLSATWEASKDPCTIELGAGWRIPTNTEWTNVDASGSWTNWNGPFGSSLKLHAAGRLLSSDGSLANRGSYGLYWSSTQYDADFGWYLYFYSGGSYVGFYEYKVNGFSIRCLRDF
ncbi:MAG: hypothetical protein NT040_19990 [Bacteroidetes bacterium]|nr:hypothetical protein [Bacteroidota bacterium]